MSTFVAGDKSKWKWTMRIMQPSIVTKEQFDAPIVEVKNKKKLTGLTKLRFELFIEGRCAQILHIGSFSEEEPNIQGVYNVINSRAFLTEMHHGIYLTDIRRADPKKWKSILRQPMI
jgi:hypothetical protein